jgi:hypothetical protein
MSGGWGLDVCVSDLVDVPFVDVLLNFSHDLAFAALALMERLIHIVFFDVYLVICRLSLLWLKFQNSDVSALFTLGSQGFKHL